MNILRKDQLEASLHEEKQLIENGRLKDDSPLDLSDRFTTFCEACRRGDLKICQEMITDGININACDQFDYTPLILASLCGHYEVVQLLLESGALCERDTFQGERCLYNALTDRIRGLLLSYDYSKSSDPLQPFASHIMSLLLQNTPKTSDIHVVTTGETFSLHKFILSSRSPYFSRKLSIAPETISWKIPPTIPSQAFKLAMRHMYLGEIPAEIGGGAGTGYSEDEVLEGIDKISKQLEIRNLWEGILEGGDRRLARQRRAEEAERGRNQLQIWFRENVLKYKIVVDTAKADEIRWDRDNAIFADVLLRADETGEDSELDPTSNGELSHMLTTRGPMNGIPIGPVSPTSRASSSSRAHRKSTLYPVHRAMLIRSDFFLAMFSSTFREAQPASHLHIVPIDCSPKALEVVLTYLYTEKCDLPLEIALDVLFAADLLMIEKLKVKAAVVISTLGNGTVPSKTTQSEPTVVERDDDEEEEVINIYDVVRAGWLTRVPRLEEFASKYFADRLESYIDEPEFAELIQESASKIKARQETDSIELLDEIRYYLSERFRLRFEDSGIEDLMDETLPVDKPIPEDEAIDVVPNDETPETVNPSLDTLINTAVRTLDGEIAGDEFARAAVNYQILLGKIDTLLEHLRLDA